MTADFSNRGSMTFTQDDAANKFWKSLPECSRGAHKSSTAPENLLRADANSPRIKKEKKDECHSTTTKCSYFSQRSRADLQLETGFHFARVKETTEQDCIKFIHLSGYLWLTRFMSLIMSIDDDGEACTCTYGAYTVHVDGKTHSGMCLTIRKGTMMNVSNKLGLVTLSSTDNEVVSDGERCSWFRYFSLAQGDEAKEDLLMQHNTSCVLLHKNNLFSVEKGSKHLHVRCFFPVDKMDKK